MSKKGFTLIELLVVIAIIALLLAILIPALNVVKQQATGIICTSNNRALAQCWHLYAGENNDAICEGHTNNDDQWLGPPRQADGTIIGGNNPVTYEEEIRGYHAGTLWDYVQNEKIYHCPGDNRWKVLERGYRTVSIQGMMNGESWDHNPSTQPPKGYVMKITEIIDPSGKYVFIENVDPRGWNLGSWIMNTSVPRWIDPIAIFHADRSTLAFADGHAEKRRWLGKKAAPPGANVNLDETIPYALKATTDHPDFDFGKPVNLGTGEEEDIHYLLRGYIPGHH